MLLEETNPFFQGQGEQRAVICKCTRCRSYLCCGKLAKESGGKTNFLNFFFFFFGNEGSSLSIHKERRQVLLLDCFIYTWYWGAFLWRALSSAEISVINSFHPSAWMGSSGSRKKRHLEVSWSAGKGRFSTRLLLPPCALFVGLRVAKHTNFQIICDPWLNWRLFSVKAASPCPVKFPKF